VSIEKIVLLAVGAVLLLGLAVIIAIRLKPSRRRKASYFAGKWKALQDRCADKKQWPDVLAEADKLLDDALKARRIKGKNMGARLVAAQKLFSDNDGVWFGHKLHTKLVTTPSTTLNKQNMQQALSGLRQGLKDLEVM
jgi:hypothetical protein